MAQPIWLSGCPTKGLKQAKGGFICTSPSSYFINFKFVSRPYCLIKRPMMVEIAVDLMSIQNTAQNANALNEEGKARIQYHNNII